MPVTIFPSQQPISAVNIYPKNGTSCATNARELLDSTCTKTLSNRCGEIFQSSFTNSRDHGPCRASSPVDNTAVRIPSNIAEKRVEQAEEAGRFAAIDLSDTIVMAAGNGNGFVDAAMRAYNTHHALVLRPDDVWMAILSQFNLFVNAHAEELRHVFVDHEGQRELTVVACGTRYTVDFGQMSNQMGILLEENIIDPQLRNWLIPDFSTTTENDKVVSSIIMMATLKSYFKYRFVTLCGIPKVTLLGHKSDWQKLLEKIHKLKDYGPETCQWHELLVPVLSRFVHSFESPNSDATKHFWQRIAHRRDGGSGVPTLSGWITAFCFFNHKGQSMYDSRIIESIREKIARVAAKSSDVEINDAKRDPWDAKQLLTLDDVVYHTVGTTDIPPAYGETDVRLVDNGVPFATVLVAGLVGVRVEYDQAEDDEMEDSGMKDVAMKDKKSDGKLNTVRPEAGWWLFEDKDRTQTALSTT
ncbi:MAG: hypothetical protein M1812_003554 [Candelaria pacifica]|nr:MAG: hypothetical protein M1812_003554 [Candelaria pacifica]